MNEHTEETPYCGDACCWCHTLVAYYDEINEKLDREPSQEEYTSLLTSFLGLDGD